MGYFLRSGSWPTWMFPHCEADASLKMQLLSLTTKQSCRPQAEDSHQCCMPAQWDGDSDAGVWVYINKKKSEEELAEMGSWGQRSYL